MSASPSRILISDTPKAVSGLLNSYAGTRTKHSTPGPPPTLMHITEAIKIALLSLWANKLRSALTLLGVVIGVAAVIAVVTFVNGINGYVATKIFILGADFFIVFKNSPAVTNIDKFLEGEKR